LDPEQLRDVTSDDMHLMRDILSALVDTTSRQTTQLAAAIRDGMPPLHAPGALLNGARRQAWASGRSTFLKKIEAHGQRVTNFND
jgi:hypothetical protein